MAGLMQSQLMISSRISQPEPVIGFFATRHFVVGYHPNSMMIWLNSCGFMGLRGTEGQSSAHE